MSLLVQLKKFGTLIVDHHRKFIIVSFLVGIAWFLALPSENLNNKTYFSENALLPGLVERDFNGGSAVRRMLDRLTEETRAHVTMPYAWIQAQFRQVGLDVYRQNFTLNYPFGSKPQYRGNNIYAILRAPKAPSTESLVLATPFRGTDSIHETTLPSVALMIEIARHFRQHAYWSKDIIFLVTEHENIGFQAWLNAYHNVPLSSHLDGGHLAGRSGPIQAVVNLEISSDKFAYIDVRIEGLNGQLPNLDLFNLAVELCSREMVPVAFHSRINSAPRYTVTSWEQNLKTMVSMMSLQATGLPNGGHGLFHRFGIQAITLASGNDHKKLSAKVTLAVFGRVVEGIYRSLNNLLERFHQSFFFYLLPSTRYYISIGLYMPPFTLIALPVLIRALFLYLSTKRVIKKKEDLSSKEGFDASLALDVIMLGHAVGFVVHLCPDFLNIFQAYSDLPTEDAMYYVHVAAVCSFLLITLTFSQFSRLKRRTYSVKLCVVLLELGAFLYTLSLVNISMATFLALLYGPVSVFIGYSNAFNKLLAVLLILLHPFFFTYFGILIQSYVTQDDAMWYEHFWHAFQGHKKVILYTVEDMYFYRNWNYKIATFALIPIWHELWVLSTSRFV